MPRHLRGARMALAGFAALVTLAAGPARAERTETLFEVGHTFAVAGTPSNGGVSVGLSVLWPVEGVFRAGVMGFAEALGDRTARLIGPGGTDLGPVAGPQRSAVGGAVRLEAHLQGRHALAPFALGTWGVYRVADDVRGSTVGRAWAAGAGLGLGLLKPFNDRHALGLTVRAQQLSRGDARHYLSAALEWRWGMGLTEGAPATATTTSSK